MRNIQENTPPTRADREKKAYDEDGVWDAADRWHRRFPHVFESPNSRRYDELFEDILQKRASGRRALEIGCSDGVTARKVFENGASYVLGIDISEELLKKAKQYEVPGGLEFRQGDVLEGVDGQFDLIFGRSILHHIDYQPLLVELHERNLAPGGAMVFMEPFGSHPLIKMYHLVARGAHTPDEKPFDKSELRWLETTFPGAQVYPINFFSFVGALPSHLIFRTADNLILRACDVVDVWIGKHWSFMKPYFRQFIVVIEK